MPTTIHDLLARRHTTRVLDPTPLDEGVVEALLEAARWAPSCRNQQPWRFWVLESAAALAAGRAALAEGNRAWAARAPVLIVAGARWADDCRLEDGRAYADLDLGLALMTLMLAATEAGLVARPMAGFEPAALRDALALDPEDRPLVMLALGRPSTDAAGLPAELVARGAQPRTRKPVDAFARRL